MTATVLQSCEISIARYGMAIAALLPQTTSDLERIDITLLPPLTFPAGGMDVVVVDGAKRNGELIAHLQTEPLGLRVAYVVRVRGSAPTDEAGLACHEVKMLLAAHAFRFAEGENTFVDFGARPFGQCFRHRGMTGAVGSAFGFYQRDGALLQVAYQLRRDPRPRQSVLPQAPIQSSHSIDVLLPDGEQELNVVGFAHGLAKGTGKFAWPIEARYLFPRC